MIALRSLLALSATLAIPAGSASATEVLVVAADGSGAYTEIQDAVDAAADGDVLLVRSGTYSGFVVLGKGLTVTTVRGAEVHSGPAEVETLPNGSYVVLQGLRSSAQDRPGLTIRNCAGSVRVQGGSLRGGVGIENGHEDGWPGVYVDASSDVVLTGCEMLGGTDAGTDYNFGDRAGAGIHAFASAVALYDCEATGGHGADAVYFDGGNGGHGVVAESSFVFLSGCEAQGGVGGYAHWQDCASSGGGGHGLLATEGGEAQVLDCELQGGSGGPCNSCVFCTCCIKPGNGEATWTNGMSTIVDVRGSARHLALDTPSFESTVDRGQSSGVVGELAALAFGTSPGFQFVPEARGVVALGDLQGPRTQLGQILIDDPLPFLLEAPPLATGHEAEVTFLQAVFVDTSTGGRVVGPPLARIVLDCTLSGDCNANGVADACETAGGAAQDCDADGVPDECQPFQDCNGNGVHDPCDIVMSPSLDCDLSGGLDACENHATTLPQDLLLPVGSVYDAAFGDVVVAEGDVLLVGAPYDDTGGGNSGRVFAYVRDATGSFRLDGRIESPTPGGPSGFGKALALSQGRVLVGSWSRVYVYERDASGDWILLDELASGRSGDNFGASVAWNDGGTAFVGAPAWSGGQNDAVYVFEEATPGDYVQTARLRSSGLPVSSRFGAAVETKGNLMFADSHPRSVHVFEERVSGWVELQQILPPPGAPGGYRSALAADGDVLVVGVAGGTNESGAVDTYRRSAMGDHELVSSLQPDDIDGDNGDFGASVSLLDGALFVGAIQQSSSIGTGAVYQYHLRHDDSWKLVDKLLPPASATWFSRYGTGIARPADDTYLVIGTPLGIVGQTTTGFVEVLQRIDDCNGNGVPDSCDIANGTSLDVDQNGLPDECD